MQAAIRSLTNNENILAALDKTMSNTGNVGGLNLAVLKDTTFQVTKWPLQQ